MHRRCEKTFQAVYNEIDGTPPGKQRVPGGAVRRPGAKPIPNGSERTTTMSDENNEGYPSRQTASSDTIGGARLDGKGNGNGSTWAAMTRTRRTSGRSGKRSPKSPTYSRIVTAIRNTKRSPPSKGRLSGSPRVPLAASIEPRPVRTAFPAGSRFGRFRGLAVATARSHAVRWLCPNPPSSRVRPGAEAAPKPPANTPANPRRVTAPSMPRATEPSPTARLIA